ncbi:pilus assembly protein N-terminal domain-containing protein [Corallococcus sp. BB11-1]|uniref:pilus assembly protein N-terminal domain-containing protein n=1 Tax=Corallococcus sp. BB11-1 TaxID=2996783 RepID=UPI00226E77EE|nr:pilus assembly protein N-terminal domain-containing protein [Corallococcus sp. BB11-1]MCY1029878.1 pilus assembly protein N-terminal domain-containing protein [Corallococcus sp. BB11-1]
MSSRFAVLALGTLLSACIPLGAREPSQATKASAKKVAQRKVDAPPADETLTLKKGAKRTLTVTGLSRVALGDPTIANVETKGADVVELSGLAPGVTTLITWDAAGKRRTYRIEVGG